MKRTVLIAEDVFLNRKVLAKILSSEFNVLQAENGKETIDIIMSSYTFLSAVILDLHMPIMSGYDVMDYMRKTPKLNNIPIIVTTGDDSRENEIKALRYGAWDFVSKPYDAAILMFRLNHAIERSQLNLFEKLRKQAETDSLTGLYNESKFCAVSRRMLDANPDKEFAVIRFDVDRFKQFNHFFGIEEGDNFLKYIAGLMDDIAVKYPLCAYGHIEADVFAVCVKFDDINNILHTIDMAHRKIREYSDRFDIVTVYGIYVIEDRDISVNTMLDRATMAAKTCKGNYIKTVAIYTKEMGDAVEREQSIINLMNTALENNEFCVYYQPKYNISTNRPTGAEALVRWFRPDGKMISPGEFIPIFEKNGFIAKVDYFVWEQVCKKLKEWCDAKFNPDPVSINISRVNLSNPSIVEILTELVEKYGINPRLLQLEITESAYMDNPEIIDKIVERLHKNGFTVLMDDFGSGYSSLNTLKEISVDILKIDMKFLPTGDNNVKSEKILASVIRMADWIGMPVICEGVETVEQRDFLQSIGCLYVQGYLYSRPIPVSDYEKLISAKPIDSIKKIPDKDDQRLNALLSADINTSTILSSIDIPVVIYGYSAGKFERIRANQNFFDIFGYQTDRDKKTIHISPNEAEKVTMAFDEVVFNRSTVNFEALFIMKNGEPKWFRLNLRYIMPDSTGHIICAAFSEITEAKRVEQEMTRVINILNASGIKRKSMLIVDDSETTRELLKSIFSGEFNIIEATDGVEALDLMKIHIDEISVILLDMIMPNMGGAEFLAIKSGIEKASKIPVAVISSDSSDEAQRDMLKSGVSDYITKPFLPEAVQKRINNVIENQDRFERLVNEYRSAISISPDIASHLTDSYLSIAETRALIAFVSPIFDIVRIVDPNTTSVITINPDNIIERNPYSCFRVWGKETRCENCSSICAMHSACQLAKYEFIENDIFYVISRPITIITDDNSSIKAVLEIVNRVSDSILSQGDDEVPIKKLVEKARKKIYCDPLTDVYNRRYLYEMLFLHKDRNDTAERVSFIMLDLNGFKEINETIGHSAANLLLKKTADVIKKQLRETDSIIRYGGDEFLIILTDYDCSEINRMIEQFRDSLKEIEPENQSAEISAEFGYSCTERFKKETDFLNKMINEAEKMMYHYKINI